MKYNEGGMICSATTSSSQQSLIIVLNMHEIYGVHIYRDTPKRLLCSDNVTEISFQSYHTGIETDKTDDWQSLSTLSR